MKRKIIALTLVFTLLFEIITPNVVFALTSGPSTPEIQSFEPIGTSEMVDLFTGDFNYNIPLLDVGGYPVNIFYHSGVSMDQEASWVGLGWNLNPGCITRNMRGLPDDFSGENDHLEKDFKLKPNITYGVNTGIGVEFTGFGKLGLNFSVGANYNNYNGVGFEQSLSMALNSGSDGKGPLTAGLGLHSSNAGLDISPSLKYSIFIGKEANDDKISTSVGTSFNSRAGLKELSLGIGVSRGGHSQKNGDFKRNNGNKGTHSFEGVNGGANISFATSTYTPEISLPLHNFSLNLSAKIGGVFTTLDGTWNIGGYYSKQSLAKNHEQIPAYGYLFSEEGQSQDWASLDFNREKDGSFTKNTPNLPVTNFTYDLYSVSGQGVGGMFRAHRNDIGILSDCRNVTTSDGINAGGEFGVGNSAKTGFDFTVNIVNSVSGKWSSLNGAKEKLNFQSISNNCQESFFFKEAGERNVNPGNALYSTLLKDEPIRIKIFDAGEMESGTSSSFLNEYQSYKNDAGKSFPNTFQQPRQPRNQHFSFISKNEYEKFANDPNLIGKIYDYTVGSNNSGNKFPKTGRHIGEITTLKTDGSRYVYGIPVYNTLQQEVTFNISKKVDPVPDIYNGTVNYAPEIDNSFKNERGDEYYNSSKLSPYAYAYLLTEVLSPDYIDLKGDGPTNDDFGTYTKFEYEKVNKNEGLTPNLYKWRVPFKANTANFNEGLKTKELDDQGNYLYGEKEIYILKKIVTKNFIAFFNTKTRHDAYGVQGENGGISASQKSYLLDNIDLYSNTSKNFLVNGTLRIDAIPIKTVHFLYNYSLCQDHGGNNNNDQNTTLLQPCEMGNEGGKLTLKQIYFTYGNSKKARLSPYEFVYSDPGHDGSMDSNYNPDYNLKGYNRWGNYKKEEGIISKVPNSEFPYVEQDKSKEDCFSSAWSLSTIFLPSGGKIKIDYESDDYAYVQDKPVMQMFKIAGVGNDPTNDSPENNNLIYTPNLIQPPLQPINPENTNTFGQNRYIYIKLNNKISGSLSSANAIFRKEYLSNISQLYFRFKIRVNQYGDEYVSGYIPTTDWGNSDNSGVIHHIDDYDYGYIKINQGNSPLDNPITKAALQFARIHTQQEAYNFSKPGGKSAEDIILALADAKIFSQIMDALNGPPNKFLNEKRYLGNDFDKARSWIRLNNPEMKKLGGGCRVRQLSISDSWGEMLDPSSPDRTFDYGQVYDYTTTTPEPLNPKIISSGVASYEPLLGNDENPFHQPVAFSDQNLFAPVNDFYFEEPFGECFFPAPSIGYSKVTVSNLPRTYQSQPITRTATGKTVHEFFTAKDFPTITKRTPLDLLPQKSGLLGGLLKLNVRDRMTASQGYSITLNNMHGKEKAQWVYSENQSAPISGMEYKYLSHGNRLDNNVSVMDENGYVSNKEIGVDYDMVADMREEESNIENVGVMVNFYGFILIIPVIVTPILPTFSHENTRFRSAVFTKVINKFGILDKTIVYDVGSNVETQNKTFDAITGEVLLTKTTNEFNDDSYSFNYPAYWAYDGMGPAYKNTGINVLGINIDNSNGKITSANNGGIIPGDEVEFINHPNWDKYWVVQINSDLYFKRRDGSIDFHNQNTSNLTIKIIRSGRRNQQGISMGSLVSKETPIPQSGKINNITSSLGIISGVALEFSEDFQTYCQCTVITSSEPNPYIIGLKGNWRKKVAYAYLTDRLGSKENNNTNVRQDGVFRDFNSFWNPSSIAPIDACPTPKNPWTKNPVNWTWTTKVTQYSPYGFEVENQDALNRFSSAQYGYDNSLPVGVSANSMYKEMGVDNMEDYNSNSCKDSHFTFYNSGNDPSVINVKNEHHSGKYSLKVPIGKKAIMVKPITNCNP